jgi:hypothetical protein
LVDTLGVEPLTFLHTSFFVNGRFGSGARLPSHSPAFPFATRNSEWRPPIQLSITFDAENRLVAGELESRWNRALLRVRELENRVSQAEQKSASAPVVSREDLLALASRRLTKRLGVSLQ